MKTNKFFKAVILSGLCSSVYANEEQPVAPALDVYENGLIATVYTENAETGTWASSKPVGVPVGEFVDQKTPVFSFSNLSQDESAWSLYPGSHIGVLWSGYFYAEEQGDYVLMIDLVKEKAQYDYHANSCTADLSLSNKSVVNNSFKWKKANYSTDDDRMQRVKTASLSLEPGYYPLNLWIHCGVTAGEWSRWVQQADYASWTLKVKRPADRIVQAAPKGTLVWK
ncbi:hypothetical protein CIF45_RS10930 [Vibrio parahaemolyticus]|nr:hypothetical protein [Vibrio parahaemolyticus]